MTDLSNPASGGDDSRPDITMNPGSMLAPANIPTEHQPYAQRILAMDAIDDVPGSAVVPEGVKLSPMKVHSLAPEMRAEVEAQLHALPPEQREAAEHELVAARVREELPSIRLKGGHGEGALPFHREMLNVTRRHEDLRRVRDQYAAYLAEVSGFETTVDPETGEAVPQEVLAIQNPVRRRAYAVHIADVERQMRLLIAPDGGFGLEGKKLVDKALAQSAALLHRRDQEAADLAEVRRRAAHINREKSIEERAQSLARVQRNGAD
ncbi:hypothetical protein [Qipengyuania psychrotolerans]|uniref:Uncharacterized protein n=1 Tax=Qipengyuania psychrotolerans TaxID=2867238 RepID=A0ABX8ZCG0_9SPHN|nr:hypothetical protein [Qipengyuania psychrotolerans]QZD86681.1 hypothetical protein K3166_10740 [Qipengyuania psychrotolerans]